MVVLTILDHFGPVHFPTVLRRLLTDLKTKVDVSKVDVKGSPTFLYFGQWTLDIGAYSRELKGTTKRDKRSQIWSFFLYIFFADFRFSWVSYYFGGADFRRKPQRKTADFCRNRFVPFSLSLLIPPYILLTPKANLNDFRDICRCRIAPLSRIALPQISLTNDSPLVKYVLLVKWSPLVGVRLVCLGGSRYARSRVATFGSATEPLPIPDKIFPPHPRF